MTTITVTRDLLAELEIETRDIIANATNREDTPSEAAHLEPVTVLTFVALQVLVPALIGTLKGIAIEEYKSLRAKPGSEAKLRSQSETLLGQHPKAPLSAPERTELLDNAIHDLERAGVPPVQARRAAILIIDRVENRLS